MSVKDSKVKDKDASEDDNDTVKKYTVFKYSTGIPLAEEIVLNGENVFLQIIDGKPVTSECIDLSEEKNMILYPHQSGLISPILPFEFKDKEEINQIIQDALSKTIDDLYFISKSIWVKIVVADEEQIILLTTDSIFTFF